MTYKNILKTTYFTDSIQMIKKKKIAKIQYVAFSNHSLKTKWGITISEAPLQSSQDFQENLTEFIRRQ